MRTNPEFYNEARRDLELALESKEMAYLFGDESDIEEAILKVRKARQAFELAEITLKSYPEKCKRCSGIDFEIRGEALICENCGAVYYPEKEYESIPY